MSKLSKNLLDTYQQHLKGHKGLSLDAKGSAGLSATVTITGSTEAVKAAQDAIVKNGTLLLPDTTRIMQADFDTEVSEDGKTATLTIHHQLTTI